MKRTFSGGIHKFNKDTQEKIKYAMGYVAQQIITDITAREPAWTGWLRASFMLTINTPATMTAMPYYRPYRPWRIRPANELPRPVYFVPPFELGDTIYITNLVPYIGFIENRNGIVKAALQRGTRNIVKIAREFKP